MDESTKIQALDLLSQGLTTDEVARRVGVPRATVSAWKAWETMRNSSTAATDHSPSAPGRFVVIRERGGSQERLVEETAIPTEAALHEVLMKNPALVPAADLGFGRVVTVGFEASLASGSADLVLIDETGRICIVEVKKEGNPDTRRVIAQLLDYAAALWGVNVEDFERDVFQRMPGADAGQSLREFIRRSLVQDEDDAEEAVERTLEGLGETLRSGAFALVLAAPTIPPSVQRVIEYLNARGNAMFGLEVSYFAGEIEAFVPRVVVQPSLGTRIAGQPDHGRRSPVEPEAYFASLPEVAQDPARAFVDDAAALGGEVQWFHYGPRVRVRGAAGPRVMVALYPDYLWLTVGGVAGFHPECGARAATRMREVPGAKVGDTYVSFRWQTSTSETVDRSLNIARDFLKDLVASVAA